MKISKACWVLLVGVMAAVVSVGGCSGSSSSPGSSSSGGNGAGMCEDTCPRNCNPANGDNDCDTSMSQVCCNYGSAGAICQDAKSCPKKCTDNTACDTSTGQECTRVSLESPQQYCAPAIAALQFCSTDSDCAANNEVCCGIYNSKICRPATECPKACASSSDCNTTSGEVCCSTVGSFDRSLSATGLCLNPTAQGATACPKACKVSSDCDANDPICCDGVCGSSCPKSCTSDNDCPNQICCKTEALHLPAPPFPFALGPSCGGTTTENCAHCGQSFGCSATTCPGCTAMAGSGSCSGFPSYSDCATCGVDNSCQCAGCTLAGGSTCSGTPDYGSCAACPTSECGTSANYCLGCTLSTTQGTCTSSGGLDPCSGLAQTNCTGSCTWDTLNLVCYTDCALYTSSGTCPTTACTWQGSCTGTIRPCSANSTATCTTEVGCQVSTAACVGTPTPCAQLNASTCTSTNQPGCNWTGGTVTCGGTFGPCSAVPLNECNNVGCTLNP